MDDIKIIPTNTEGKAITKPDRKQRREEIKKRQFIKAYLELKDATKAYMQVYKVKERSASTLGYNLLKSIDFSQLLELGGITDAILKEKLQEGLQATRPYGKDNIIHPDYATRHSYVTTTLKLKKRLQEDKQQQPIMQGLQVIINK